MKKIRVLVADDNAFIRRVIGDIILTQPDLELVGTAADGREAINLLKSLPVDVITLDLEMPRLGGLAALKEIMAWKPLPVIVVSSYTREGSRAALQALSYGAVDFVPKPGAPAEGYSLDDLSRILPQKIRIAASATLPQLPGIPERRMESGLLQGRRAAGLVVAMGASTGGPRTLEYIFSRLPADLPAAIMVVQHMPAGFTFSFAERLNRFSALRVKEAADGDPLLEGLALVAPGGYHLKGERHKVTLDSGPKVHFVRPAVDVMFSSLAESGHRVVAVVLTGMGSDGSAGARRLKQSLEKAVVIVQDPQTAVIRNMPESVIAGGCYDAIVPLTRMAGVIEDYVRELHAEK